MTARLVAAQCGEAKGKRIVHGRSGGRCEGCGGTDCLEWSHRRAKGQGGSWRPSNGLRLDRRCHAWAEANPFLADALGWRLVHRDDDPTTALVWLLGSSGTTCGGPYPQGWHRLDDDGGVRFVHAVKPLTGQLPAWVTP